MTDDANELIMGGGAKAFAFDNIGDTCSGTIVSYEKRQQRDLNTNQLAFWDDGNPKWMVVVVIQTDAHENDQDDGCRSVYLRGGNGVAVKGKGTASQVAVKDAILKAGATGMEVGAYLALQYSGEGSPPNKGFNAPKLYSATYKPPAQPELSMDDLA